MQTFSAAFQAELDKGLLDPTVLVDLYEFYPADYVPGPDGFDPADAVERFAGEQMNWNGFAYRREVISRGDIILNMTEKTNTVSTTFSNISRYLATMAQTQVIEGMLLCIRIVSPIVIDDSKAAFHGRCDKPGDIDKGKFPLTARQDFGNINQEIPPRRFTAEDPEGRVISDPLYEGYKLLSTAGSFVVPVTSPSTSFFGRLFGRTKTTNETRQFSSIDNTPYGSVVPMQFGLVQCELIPIYFVDEGYNLGGFWVIGEGRVDNFIVTVHNDMLQQTQVDHYGDIGGTGSNADLQARLGSYLSRTAYTARSMYGSAGDVVDEPPLVTALIRGLRIPSPDAAGVFNTIAWSDNGVCISRYVLTDPRLVNIHPGFMEDPVNYQTFLHCNEPLIDETNSQLIPIPNPDLPQAGVGFFRFRPTGQITPRSILYNYLGDGSIVPELVDGPYEGFDPADPPMTFAKQALLIKRYTTNVPLTDAMPAMDFLWKIVFPSFKGYLRGNKRGKYEIRSEKAEDNTRLRAATAVAATALLVLDVTPWTTGNLLIGRLLTGFNLLTSEVRDILTATYTADGNAIPLTAGTVGGGVTAVASGANLAGGSAGAQASGTVTLGGAPAAGNTVNVTINGILVSYILTGEDTTGTAASMLAAFINATPRLKLYIRAYWDAGTPNVVTIKCLYGVLNLSSSLLKTHAGPIADPTVAPTVAASAGGTLKAGTYELAYSNANAIGRTALTPLATINIIADQKLDVSALPALPAGITERNFYLSDQANSDILKFVAQRTDAANFSIPNLPLPGAAIPPSFNTTAEELLRVAMSFATNSQDVLPAWKPDLPVLLGDVYLPTVLNGHKYDISAITTGITGSAEPVWPTVAGATVVSGGVTFREIGSTVLQQAGLTRANIVKDTFSWPKGSTQSSVNQLKGSYRDPTNDFALTPIRVNDRAHQAHVKKTFPKDLNIEAVNNLHQALRLLNGDLAKNREGDWFDALTGGPRALGLEEGDIICASDDSGGLVNVVTRCEELRIKPNHHVEITQARKYSTMMFSDDVASQEIVLPSTLRRSVTANSIIEFIDNHPTRDSEGLVPGFVVAVSRDLAIEGDWRGWSLWGDYGDGYKQISQGNLPAIMGTATSILGVPADPVLLDVVNDLTFTLKFGPPAPFPNPFVSVTQADLDANPRLNLFHVRGVNGGEYVQAATIVDNGNQSYTISDLYRGRFATDGPELVHGAGETVVYLDGSEVFVEIDANRKDLPFNYKAVTINQDVADATPVSFTWTGKSQRPKRPIDLAGLRIANDLVNTWEPAEPDKFLPEKYIVRVYSLGGTLKRTHTILLPDWTPVQWNYHSGVGNQALVNRDPDGSIYMTTPLDTDFLQYVSQQFFGDVSFAFDVDDRPPFYLIGFWGTGLSIENGIVWDYSKENFVRPEFATFLARRLQPLSRFEINIKNGQGEYFIDEKLWTRSFQGVAPPMVQVIVIVAGPGAGTGGMGPQGALHCRVRPFVPRQFIYTDEMAKNDFAGVNPGMVRIDVTQVASNGSESPIATINA